MKETFGRSVILTVLSYQVSILGGRGH